MGNAYLPHVPCPLLPAGSEALPAGSEALPAGAKALPAGSEALPAGSETLPAGSETLPVDSEALPVDPSYRDASAHLKSIAGTTVTVTELLDFLVKSDTLHPPH